MSEKMITISHVNRIFPVPGGTFQALKDINAQIEQGTFTILKGRSGSGKTTLLNIIGALDLPTSGEVHIAGQNIVKLSEYEREGLRRKEMGFVFQAVSLIPTMNAFQNVEFSMRLAGVRSAKEREERVKECLKLVGLSNRMTHMPSEMSGGEQQRVAIARALVNRPSILLADEPTGNLDPKNSWEIMKLLEQINENGTTVLVVTHNREIVNAMQKRVITMKKGIIVSDEEKGVYIDED